MKYTVKIDDITYQVELGDLHTQPIIALVNGEPVEVFLESEGGMKPYFALQSSGADPAKTGYSETASPTQTSPAAESPVTTSSSKVVTAPIPGVILAVEVKPGDSVSSGQVLCVLEAMKMKNTLRAAREGIIAAVFVTLGETVPHGAPLMEYEA